MMKISMKQSSSTRWLACTTNLTRKPRNLSKKANRNLTMSLPPWMRGFWHESERTRRSTRLRCRNIWGARSTSCGQFWKNLKAKMTILMAKMPLLVNCTHWSTRSRQMDVSFWSDFAWTNLKWLRWKIRWTMRLMTKTSSLPKSAKKSKAVANRQTWYSLWKVKTINWEPLSKAKTRR